MIPIKLTNDTWPPKDGEFCSSIVLYYDNWNDYSYRTSFVMCYCDADGMVREVGNVKIYYWQNDEVRTNQYSEHTKSSLGDHIESLSASYCSLGQELSYYKNLKALLPNDYFDILTRLNDIAIFDAIKNRFINEKGVQSSLLRFSGAEKALNEAKGIIYEGLQTTKDIDGVLHLADALFQLCQFLLGISVIVGGAHGLHVLAHGGAEVLAAVFLVQQGGVLVVELFQQLVGLRGSICHGRSSFLFCEFLLPLYLILRRKSSG